MSEPKRASRCENPKSNRTTELRAISNASASRKSRMSSRLPVRSHSFSVTKKDLPKAGPKRVTSPSPSQFSRLPTKKSDDVSTGDNVSKSGTDKSKTNSKAKWEPRINKSAGQRISRATSVTPAKTNIRKASVNAAVDNKKKQEKVKANAVPETSGEPLPSATPPSSRIIQTNASRAIDVQHKKLQEFQSEFMRKLGQLGRLGQHKMDQYKFVAVIMNEKCKLVVKDDNLVGMPKFLPAESVYDLKERCRQMVDSGFAMMSDNIASIHKAKDEAEASAAREKLLGKMQVSLKQEITSLITEIDRMCCPSNSKLSTLQCELNEVRAQKIHLDSRILEIKREHSSALTQLRLDHAKAMSIESEKRDKIIANLEKSFSQIKKDKEQMESNYKKERGDMLSPLQHDNSIELANRDKSIADLMEALHKCKEEKYSLEKRLFDARNKQPDANEKSEIAKRDQIISDLKSSLREAMAEKPKIEICHKESSSQTLELCEYKETISDLKDALREAEQKNKQLEETCAEYKKKIHQLRLEQMASCSSEKIITDLKHTLRQSEDRKEYFERLYIEIMEKYNDLKDQLQQMPEKPAGTEMHLARDLLTHSDVLTEKKPVDKDTQKAVELLRTEAEKLKTINAQVHISLEKANENLELYRKNIKANEERISFLENELKQAHDQISYSLENRPNHVDEGLLAANRTVAELRSHVSSLEQHRRVLSEDVNKLMAQHLAFDELTTKLEESQVDISDLKKKLKVTESQLMKRTEAELKLRNELNLSKEELCKLEVQVNRLNEQLERDRQLLSVRTDMINALQKHDDESRQKVNEMYSELQINNDKLTQVKSELASRDEEFRNLFGTLSSKQMEVSRQEHIIKLLEENNKRGSMLRLKQEERNAVMQDEIIKLRSSMRDYAKVIIGNNGQNCFEVVTDAEVLDHHQPDQEINHNCPDLNCKFHCHKKRFQSPAKTDKKEEETAAT